MDVGEKIQAIAKSVQSNPPLDYAELDSDLTAVLEKTGSRREALAAWRGGLTSEFANRVLFVLGVFCPDVEDEWREMLEFVGTLEVPVYPALPSNLHSWLTDSDSYHRALKDPLDQMELARLLCAAFVKCTEAPDDLARGDTVELALRVAHVLKLTDDRTNRHAMCELLRMSLDYSTEHAIMAVELRDEFRTLLADLCERET